MRILCFVALWFISLPVMAQMPAGTDTLYGHEWVNFGKTYLKIETARSGVYRISQEALLEAGIPADSLQGSGMALYFRGKKLPVWVSTEGLFGPDDYFLFAGQPNDDFLDRFCFLHPDQDMLNPGYSMVNDTAAYFLAFNEPEAWHYAELPNQTTGLPTPEPWFMHQEIVRQTQNFIKRPNGLGSPSRFQAGDGFSGPALSEQELNIPADFLAPAGPRPRLHYRMIANNSAGHDFQIAWNGEPVRTWQFNFFRYIRDSLELETSRVQAINRFRFSRLGPQENRYSLAFLRLEYPRLFSLNGQNSQTFSLKGSGWKHILYSNVLPEEFFLFLPGEGKLIRQTAISGELSFGVEQEVESARYLVWQSGVYESPARLKKVEFNRPDPDGASFVMLYHKAVQYDSNGADVVAEYLSYRESAGVKAFGVEVEPLYDLFGYGVDRHFVALRNYFAWLKKHAPSVEHVFLAGKGLDITHARRPEQWPQMETSFFIPVYGVPGSDQLLVSSNHQLDQWFPIGRLPVTRGDELRAYLDKVKAYESLQKIVQEERVRRGLKKVIHIHGGRNALEQSQLGGILDRMRGELEQSAFAAEVYSFGKQSNEPVQGSAPEKIYQLINEGTGWISFLGHSGSTTLDFDIDNLALYTNRHRYPFFIALGCSVGNIFSPVRSFGERFNLISEKGTILFFATSGLGYPATLEGYARQIYSEVGESRQGVSFGQIVQKVHLANASTPNRLLQETIEQHVLNGDPSLKPHYAEKPDYLFDPESLRREPAEITVQDDSVIFHVDLVNVGKNQKDTVSIGYTLLYPDGREISGTKDSLPLAAFRNPATLSLGLSEKAISGTYTLTMRIDPEQVLSEGPLPEALSNNDFRNPSGNAGIRFFVGDPQVRLLYPPDLYITGHDTIRLYAQSGNMSREPQGYKIQVDTTLSFLSPKEIQVNVPANSSQISTVFDVAGYPDSTTFYWRAIGSGRDTVLAGRAFSFTRIKGGGSGLGMFTEEQFARGKPLSMGVDSTGRWRHAQVDRQYLIRNSIFLNSGYPSGFYDGQRINSFFPFVSVLEGVGVVVLSPETGYRWSNPSPGRFGSINSSGVSSVCFPYPTRQPAARAALMTFLKDSIPSGATVLMYSLLRTNQSTYGAEDWAQDSVSFGQNLFQVLEQEGFDRIRELADAPGHSFILSYTKGAGPIDFRLAVQPTDTLISTGVVAESLPEGQYEWASHALQDVQRVFWSGQEPEERDMASQQVDFLNPQSLPRSWTAASGDQAWAPEKADTLRLSLKSENQALAAFQLKNWGFYGTQKPDLCWSGLDLKISSDTLLQGAPLSMEAEIANLSAETCPPFTVWLQILDRQNNVYTDTLLLDSLLPFEGIRISHTFRQSAVSTGLNRLLLTLNPENTFGEISIENNGLEKAIFIQADQAGPVLDIWVDGRRILDGDLVSARPEIEIRLQDSHPILLLDNPEMIKIQWVRPGSQGVEDIPVNSPGISFFPAEPGGKNEARLIYRPEQLEDGIHQLLVQGYDTQGNPAGRDPWRIRFQVINQAAISALANYPNPFSSSTRFVYTLSGQASPSAYHIRIYTVSGQLVREIQQGELGPLKVGKHLTDYAWDGRDQYGNLLANGVYLYRLELSDTDREEVQSMETRLDNFTTAGWSKMVILR